MKVRLVHPRRLRRTLVAAVAVAAVAPVVGAAPALATPTGEFAPFAHCPLKTPELGACLVATSTSGEFVVGSKTVPLSKAITLQGGFTENPETGAETFVGAEGTSTLSPVPQTVPGGLVGIEGLGGEVTATTELAGAASSIGINEENLLSETGTALALPVKVKLGNPILGGSCYVGSNSSPIVLNLTTGTTSPPKPNKAIKGKLGEPSTNEEGTILTISKNTLVNNSFAAPGAQGCGLIPLLVDPLVDLAMGVPAGAGHNTVILNGTLKQASAAVVAEH
jgi:hypothetical protein